MKKRIPVVILLLAAVGAIAWSLNNRDGDANGNLLYGNVDLSEVDLAFRVGGRIASMSAREGDRVEAGEAIAELDGEPLADAVAIARASVRQAEIQLERLRAGSRPQEIARGAARVSEAEAGLDSATRELTRQQEMMADDATSQRELDQASTSVAAAKARLDGARQDHALLVEGPRVEDIAAAEAAVETALARLAQAETALADATLIAPSTGTLVTRARRPGEMVQPGQPVYVLSLDDPVQVRAYVEEPRLGRVSPGTRVEVRRDGSDKVHEGQIGFVSPRAEFTPRAVETEALRTDLVYRLRIEITNPDEALREGMPVTVVLPEAPSSP